MGWDYYYALRDQRSVFEEVRFESVFQAEELASAKTPTQEELDVFKEQQGGPCDWSRRRKGGVISLCLPPGAEG